MKAKVVVPLALVFVLLAAVPIYAAPPVIESGRFDVVSDDEFTCPGSPGFGVSDHMVGLWRTTTFYDREGHQIEQFNHYVGIDNLFNPANPSVVLSGNFSSHDNYNLVTGEYTWEGSSWAIKIPGYGMVIKQAGLYKDSTGRLVGIHTVFDPEALEQRCALLQR
jgi:hypothetical protein